MGPEGSLSLPNDPTTDLRGPDLLIDLVHAHPPAPAPTRPDPSTDAHAVIDPGPTPLAPWQRALKRMVDLVLASVTLAVAVPMLVVLAVVIAIDSPGGPIFRQTRVGLGGQTFTFYKFRTMYVDARERFPQMYAYQYDPDDLPTLYFKHAHDLRLTRVGAWLRRTSLDELPNLVNVVRGEMSLVGPRPEIPEMLRYYRPEEQVKFAVKPGMTGLAQINGRNILRFRETNAFDVRYVESCSLRTDLSVLLRTPVAVLKMLGAL